jgi:hypothetical protein
VGNDHPIHCGSPFHGPAHQLFFLHALAVVGKGNGAGGLQGRHIGQLTLALLAYGDGTVGVDVDGGIPADELFTKEFGVTYKETIGTHENYWDTLATLKASGHSPDIVMLPNWNFRIS